MPFQATRELGPHHGPNHCIFLCKYFEDIVKKKKNVCVHTSVNVCVSKTNLAPNLRICTFRDFAGSPPSSARGAASVPVWEAKIPYTLQPKSYKTKAIL